MSTPNTGLLQQVAEHVEWYGLEPQVIAARRVRYDVQVVTYGVEGHAIDIEHPAALWHWEQHPANADEQYATLVTPDGSLKKPGRNASHVARQLLGLDRSQADRLFGAQTADAAQQIIAELIKEADAAAS